jgi:hypothetical protein
VSKPTLFERIHEQKRLLEIGRHERALRKQAERELAASRAMQEQGDVAAQTDHSAGQGSSAAIDGSLMSLIIRAPGLQAREHGPVGAGRSAEQGQRAADVAGGVSKFGSGDELGESHGLVLQEMQRDMSDMGQKLQHLEVLACRENAENTNPQQTEPETCIVSFCAVLCCAVLFAGVL